MIILDKITHNNPICNILATLENPVESKKHNGRTMKIIVTIVKSIAFPVE